MMNSLFSARPAWVEINLDCVAHNIKQIKAIANPETEIMAVVKADGYGHGAAAIAGAALNAGASSLAVAFVEEGIDLRRAGIEVPVLLLGYTDPAQFPALVQYNLIPTVFGYDTALQFSCMAVQKGIKLPLHLKIDTGMGRIGLLPDEAVEVISRVIRMPGLEVEGLFTHLAAAEEEDNTYTSEQLKLFKRIIGRLESKGIYFKKLHTANSAASINCPNSYYNLMRIGLAMYGHYPSPTLENGPVELWPALTFKSRVVLVKKLPPGSSISYGCTFRTSEESLIATIPVGYADGYSRLFSNKGHVLIRGQRAPVVGRVCMDHLMVDVTGIPGVRLNDEVVLYGKQGGESITVEEAAGLIGTVNYELLCSIDKRVSRFYFQNNRLISIHDFIEDHTFS
ncbi:MAG: alanine racemase [Bacillota bacterium]|nr:alanine racemase [Bacillota bacterium]